ncbi:DUF2834 domain-containing protein [Nodosilinea sp. E11]|uniref:DUF2834 domain-containing protein n=1 Tax=Nodosilinea sp. E11 TaxID=3037479 RepID=UPI002934CC95|nr:DUF2834 domain-containing protein [Nodosilinea sp. E11]WOD39399.1 DUF2834 domain-containing protein [Nodosilinea sp. E11]
MSNSVAPSFNRPSHPWLQWVYLGCLMVGAVLPWWFLAPFFQQYGFAPAEFLHQALANPVAIDLAIDLLISTLVFFIWVWIELPRLGLGRGWWGLCVVATLGIGLSCGLPLFLLLRHRQLTVA